jgi:hypothetical protein
MQTDHETKRRRAMLKNASVITYLKDIKLSPSNIRTFKQCPMLYHQKILPKGTEKKEDSAKEYILNTVILIALLLAFLFIFCPVINELWIK